jgi:hypothetical protein
MNRAFYWPGGAGYGARIFVNKDAPESIHAELRNLCKWGNYDKTVEQNGREYAGYEFGDKDYARARVVVEWFKILGLISDIKDHSL